MHTERASDSPVQPADCVSTEPPAQKQPSTQRRSALPAPSIVPALTLLALQFISDNPFEELLTIGRGAHRPEPK